MLPPIPRLFSLPLVLGLGACAQGGADAELPESLEGGAIEAPTAGPKAAPDIDADVEALDDWKGRIRSKFPSVRGIAVADLAAELGEGTTTSQEPLLLDVRAPEEYAVSQIHGALRAETIEEALAVLREQPRDRRIVVYCSIGYRSAEMVEQLNERGFENAVNLEGSIFEWGNTGRAVHRGEEQVEWIHPFDATWGLLLDARLRAPVDER